MNSDSGFRRRFLVALGALFVFGAVGAASPVLAQQGAIRGQVTASGTGSPLSGAQVFVAGTDIGTITGEDGSYRLTGVPAGQQTVQVRMIGYQRSSRQVNVRSGQATTADFALTVSAVSLQDVVVTATGEQRLREIGNTVSTVSADSIVDTAPVRDFSDLLTGRSAGVTVETSSGSVGASSRIRIRGSASISVDNSPLVYVDGTRINVDQGAFTEDLTGGQDLGTLNINPEEIQSIEVLKGASAATLYGTEAANGVIRITTKDGSGMEGTEWRLWGEGGLLDERTDWPANVRAVNSAGAACPNWSAALGACTQAELQSFNLLENEQTTPFRDVGGRYNTGGSVTGSVEGVRYFASGEFERQNGVFEGDDELTAVNMRGNFGGQLAETLNLQVNTGWTSRDILFPQNDNNSFGFIPNALLGGPTEDGWFAFTPGEISQIDTKTAEERFTGSATLRWTPAGWLTANVNAGMDVASRRNEQFFPPGAIASGRLILGQRSNNDIQSENFTGESFFRADLPLTEDIRSRTTVGGQLFVEQQKVVQADGEDLAPTSNSIGTAAVTFADEFTTESRTIGGFVEQRFSWRDRLFVTGGLRVDDNSAFGEELGAVAYPKANFSWVLSEEPWFPSGNFLSSLRIRGAWGQSGNQPGTTDALRFLSAQGATSPLGEDRIAVTFEGGNLGNPDLKPERSNEFEAGFETSFLNGRVTWSGTYYHTKTSDALVQRTVAPSLGVSSQQFVNLAEVTNEGVESQLDALVLDRDNVRLNLNFSGSYNDNTLNELGEGVSPIIFGLGGDTQRHTEGVALGSYFQPKIESFNDENGDGLLSPSEVEVADSATYIDEARAPVQISANPSLTLFGDLRIASQWETRLGHSLFNNNGSFRCLFANNRAANDADAPLEEQAACIGSVFLGTDAGWIQEADFLRLRELSISYTLPRELTQRLISARSLSLTLAGRNLGLWTEYGGLDPENNQFGGGANFATAEFLTQPPLRYFSARVSVTF